MRRLITQTFLTLDGIMQAPGGPDEDPSGGFAHGGWTVPYWGDAVAEVMDETMGRQFDLVLGRNTYEIFAGYWPHADGEIAAKLNGAAKHVASTTLTEVAWENASLIGDDVPAGVAALKEQDGPELQVHGSGGLIQTLLAHGLVDEMRILLYPLVLGGGKRLFAEGAVPAALRLASARALPNGVVAMTYEPAGEVEVGSFDLEEPAEAEAR